MGFLLATVRKDIRRRLADPLALTIWIGLPVLFGVLITLFVGAGQSTPTVHVLVANQDDSPLTEALVGGIGQGATAGGLSFRFEVVDMQTGRARIDDGDGTALLVVPPDFGAAVLNEEPTTLTLITNPAESILPSIVIEALEIFREGAFYAQRVFGESFEASAARELLERPPLMLDFDNEGAEAAADTALGGSIASFILPGMILMSILFVAQGMSDDLWQEKDQGTLGRMLHSPQLLSTFVAGKLLAGLVVIAIVATMGLAAAVALFDVPLDRSLPAIAWCTYAGTAMLGLFLFISMLGTSHRTSNLITMMLLFPLMMVGGSFSPFAAMPGWMRAIGVWTPNGIAVEQLNDILFSETDPLSLVVSASIIAATAGASLLLCALRSRRFIAL